MANKKLKVEVELDTAKAKRQAKELESSGTGGASVSTVSPSADRASRQIRDLGRAAEGTQVNMKAAGKAFAGVAVGLAASYAANNMKQGTARTAVEYGGSIVSGASAGMMFGPIGAALGGVAGALKTFIDSQSAISKATEDFAKADDNYEDNRLWQAKLRNLSEVEESPVGMKEEEARQDQLAKVEEKLIQSRKVANELFDEQNRTIKRIKELLKKGETKEAETLQEQLATTRTRKEQAEALERSFAKQKKSIERQIEEDKLKTKTPEFRESITATDSLQKIGLGGPAAEAVAATVASVSSTRAGRGFGFSVPERSFQETKFGNFEKPNNDFKIITPLESAERNGRMSLETLRNIYQAILNKNGGVAWQ